MQTKQEVFDELISRDLGMLRAAAFRILGNSAEVDEVVQDALLVAWNKYNQFHTGAKLSTWVYRITVNQCFDHLRRRKREAVKLKAYAETETETPEESPRDGDQVDALMAAVAELPKLYRDSITIGVLSGFSAAQAALTLKCSVNTLYQRIHQAKKMLRKKLETA